MIVSASGDIFKSNACMLVNPVNCVGVMGAGLAKQFRIRYPETYEKYRDYCDRGYMSPGKVLCNYENGKWIACLPTKQHWSENSKLEYIEVGMKKLTTNINHLSFQPEFTSVAIPKLGCGLGGLDWLDVKPIILDAIMQHVPDDITVYLYET